MAMRSSPPLKCTMKGVSTSQSCTTIATVSLGIFHPSRKKPLTTQPLPPPPAPALGRPHSVSLELPILDIPINGVSPPLCSVYPRQTAQTWTDISGHPPNVCHCPCLLSLLLPPTPRLPTHPSLPSTQSEFSKCKYGPISLHLKSQESSHYPPARF